MVLIENKGHEGKPQQEDSIFKYEEEVHILKITKLLNLFEKNWP